MYQDAEKFLNIVDFEVLFQGVYMYTIMVVVFVQHTSPCNIFSYWH